MCAVARAEDNDPVPEYEAKPGGARRPAGRVRGRLLANLAFWQAICVSSVVLSWIVSGFPLPFAGAPPAPRSFENQPSAFEHAEFVDEAIASLIASDAAGVVPYTPTVISPLGVVAKKSSGKLRLIINMRYLNSHLEKRKFKFETVAVLSDLLSVSVAPLSAAVWAALPVLEATTAPAAPVEALTIPTAELPVLGPPVEVLTIPGAEPVVVVLEDGLTTFLAPLEFNLLDVLRIENIVGAFSASPIDKNVFKAS